jgi:hypothetical protein
MSFACKSLQLQLARQLLWRIVVGVPETDVVIVHLNLKALT